MTKFPVSLDQFNNPTSSTKTNAPGFDHAEQHTNANDAIEALQSKIGIDQSLDKGSIDFKIRTLLPRVVVHCRKAGSGPRDHLLQQRLQYSRKPTPEQYTKLKFALSKLAISEKSSINKNQRGYRQHISIPPAYF